VRHLLVGSCSAFALLSCQASPDPVPEDAVVVKLAGGMQFTEGPVWLPGEQALVFSDIPASRLMRWSEADGLSVYRTCDHPNGNLLDQEGRLLTCQHGARNIVRTEQDGSITVLVDRFDGKRFHSPNDLAVHSDGTLWFTDPPWGLPAQTEGKEYGGHWVFRVDSSTGIATPVIRDLVMPNGIALSPDESVLYVADTGGHTSHPDPRYYLRPATLSAYRLGPDHRLDPAPLWCVETLCDGMCVDEHGNIYATGQAVTVWSPDGTQIDTIEVPEQPANVCFGGNDNRTLFITARTSLYAVRLRVAGLQHVASGR